MNDVLPAPLTLVSLSAAGWSCDGTIACSRATLAPGTSNIVIQAKVPASVAAGTNITNTASATSATADPSTPNNGSASGAATLPFTATKIANGPFREGQTTSYTIVIANVGALAHADNPGDEFVDTLPSSLALLSVTATSGTAVAEIANNRVRWNGAIAAGTNVTITINARIRTGAAGTQVTNRGTATLDFDGDGINESTLQTAEVSFTAEAAADAPTLSVLMTLLLAAVLVTLAVLRLR